MNRLRARQDGELLTALKRLLKRLNIFRMSEPHDKAAAECERGIRNKIEEIEQSDDDSLAA
jgi:hypothetical protein